MLTRIAVVVPIMLSSATTLASDVSRESRASPSDNVPRDEAATAPNHDGDAISGVLAEIAASEKLSAREARDLDRGEPISRTRVGDEGGRSVEGYIVLDAPMSVSWKVLSDPRTAVKYSSCLRDVQELARTLDGGLERLVVRETHSAFLMSWRYTVDRIQDAAKGEIRWTLDPTAENDVSELAGSWRLIRVNDRSTLVVLRMSGDMGGALGSLGTWFAKRHVPEGLQEVKQFIEASAREARNE